MFIGNYEWYSRILFFIPSHWEMWGNRKICFHFLLFPFLFPPPPENGIIDSLTKSLHMGAFYCIVGLLDIYINWIAFVYCIISWFVLSGCCVQSFSFTAVMYEMTMYRERQVKIVFCTHLPSPLGTRYWQRYFLTPWIRLGARTILLARQSDPKVGRFTIFYMGVVKIQDGS